MPGLAQGLLLLVEVDSVFTAWATGSPGCVHLDLVTLIRQTWTGTREQITYTECHAVYTDRQQQSVISLVILTRSMQLFNTLKVFESSYEISGFENWK